MSEEQAASVDETVTQEGAESAPASEGQHEEKVTFSEAQQAKLDEIIGEQTFKRREAERELKQKLEEAERRAQELESKIAPQTRPEIPDMPDPYEDDYEERVKARDEAIRKAAAFDAEQESRQQQERRTQEQQALEEAKALQEAAQTYTDRAIQQGMTAEELDQAGQVVRAFGVSNDIATFILNDEQGPLITKYLAKHPQELDAISSMNPIQGLVTVATKVKEKAAALSAKTSDAPPPPEELEGGGIPKTQRGPAGVTYE